MSKNHHTSAAARLFVAVVEGVQSWWRVDRIRVSPREGRLLRIAPGSVLCVAGTVLEITQRTIHDTSDGPLVQYQCRGSDRASELWIAAEPMLTIRWLDCGEQRELSRDDIEVWGPEFMGRPNCG